ncbi:MAG: hypothetical protein KDJ52_20580 [Anaerolineae bacterium]|nr:hypothetical protein [Anaerolineae bacterium]
MENLPNTLTIPQSGQLTIDIHLSAEVNVTAVMARRKVNAFLATHVGNLLLADEPVLSLADKIVWRVPVDLTTPAEGRLGRVAEIEVDVQTGAIAIDEAHIARIRDHANRLATGSPL